ncbi:glutathione ABC transporter substrate-binding protein GsiB [Achromobacter xylosoxidans]|uniref:glutathione ABC transporter substrate-binding protein GsiB n=1 Tax=Alcaligenes xylosoxydans xylosoxydans TaxID=85698 RepID=UPI001F139AED|nr:glutathione ABC transporter substrate-binding protein GsiB [Achromobacter xylosoxidans]
MNATRHCRIAAATALFIGLISSSLVYAAKDVTFAVSTPLESLDPYNTSHTLTQAAGKAYYESLFEFDKDMKIQPLLATGYEISADNLVYTFKLRHGVKFQDGTDFNAEAVKANFDRASNPDNRLSRYLQFSQIAKTEVVDTYTVRITLKKPFSPFINAVAHPAAMMISPTALQKYGKEIGFHPVGTGPFEFVEWKPAEYLKVKKFDGYWNKEYPKIDTLTFRTVVDNNSRAAVIQTGEAQFAYPVPFEQAALLSKNDRVIVKRAKSIFATYLAMNMLRKPFDNPKVRQAINYAINKKALAKVAYAGYADVSNGVVPEGIEFGVKLADGGWPYDPNKARELLKEAGYPSGFESSIWSAYNDGTSVKVVQFLQQQLAQVGIKVSVEVLEPGQRSARVGQVRKAEDAQVRMYYSGWSASTGEADWALRPLFASESTPPQLSNIAYYSSPKVDAALSQALTTSDHQEKAQLYREVQETVWNDAPWAFLLTTGNLYMTTKNITGVEVLPDTSLSFRDVDLK